MSIIDVLKSTLNQKKKIDVKKLPSQGLFYKDNFEMYIKKADIEDINEYEYKYDKEDLSSIIYKLKNAVQKNTILPNKYSFTDIKSIDIIFIFLEIVKFTNNKEIVLKYLDNDDKEKSIEFSSKYFNYFNVGPELINKYDSNSKQFIIDDYRFSLPSIGIENSITNFLISKSDDLDADKYNQYTYDFMFFLGDKKRIKYSEIDNLIQIFNFDMEDSEMRKVKKIIKIFQPMQKYSLKVNDKIIEINSQINLETIWK